MLKCVKIMFIENVLEPSINKGYAYLAKLLNSESAIISVIREIYLAKISFPCNQSIGEKQAVAKSVLQFLTFPDIMDGMLPR